MIGEECPVRYAQKVLSGKWKVEIIARIMMDSKSFTELEKEIDYITSATLNNNLKELINLNIIEKRSEDNKATKSKYVLTRSGEKLRAIIGNLIIWSSIEKDLNNEETQKKINKILKEDEI